MSGVRHGPLDPALFAVSGASSTPSTWAPKAMLATSESNMLPPTPAPKVLPPTSTSSLLSKGDDIWYRHRSGVWMEGRVTGVDLSLYPPSYQVETTADATIRDTERPRLKPRFPGESPPPADSTMLQSAAASAAQATAPASNNSPMPPAASTTSPATQVPTTTARSNIHSALSALPSSIASSIPHVDGVHPSTNSAWTAQVPQQYPAAACILPAPYPGAVYPHASTPQPQAYPGVQHSPNAGYGPGQHHYPAVAPAGVSVSPYGTVWHGQAAPGQQLHGHQAQGHQPQNLTHTAFGPNTPAQQWQPAQKWHFGMVGQHANAAVSTWPQYPYGMHNNAAAHTSYPMPYGASDWGQSQGGYAHAAVPGVSPNGSRQSWSPLRDNAVQMSAPPQIPTGGPQQAQGVPAALAALPQHGLPSTQASRAPTNSPSVSTGSRPLRDMFSGMYIRQ